MEVATVIWTSPAQDALLRVRAEYLEMPGLSLTHRQACRLWGLDPRVCATLLDTLVDQHFLRQTRQGAFVRADAEQPGPPQVRQRVGWRHDVF